MVVGNQSCLEDEEGKETLQFGLHEFPEQDICQGKDTNTLHHEREGLAGRGVASRQRARQQAGEQADQGRAESVAIDFQLDCICVYYIDQDWNAKCNPKC